MKNEELKGKNLKYLRANNTNEILKVLATTGESSRIDLSKLMGLSKMTITNIINQLLERGYVVETRSKVNSDNSITGPKPMLLTVAKNKVLAIGVCISKDSIECCLSDIKNGIINTNKTKINNDDNQERIEQKIIKGIREIIHRNYEYKNNIIGIGVVSVGLVDSNLGVISKIKGLDCIYDFRIKRALELVFPYPVYVSNDVQGAILAEQLYGQGREKKNFLYLGISQSIGSAVVSDGRIMTGSLGFATEAGHMSIDYNGPRCSCGNRGCLELYISIPVLLKKSNSSRVEEMMDKYRHKDKLTVMVLTECMDILDIAITNLINLVDPECVIFGHEGAQFPLDYLSLLEDRINQHVIKRGNKRIELTVSSFEKNSTLRGATSIVFSELFNGNIELELGIIQCKELISV